MREFFESIIAYVSGPTVAALIIGVWGKTYYDIGLPTGERHANRNWLKKVKPDQEASRAALLRSTIFRLDLEIGRSDTKT